MGGGLGRRDRGSQEESRVHTQGVREQRRSRQEGHPNKKIKANKTPKKDKQRGQGRAGGGGSREPTKAQRYTTSRAEKRHADDPH